jgi:two-component system, response regulator RegA
MGEVRTVLVVEDDVQLLATYQHVLARTGNFVVSGASSVDDAKEAVRAHRPDAAIVDLNIAGESGIDLIAELRAQDPDIRLVLISGYNSVESTVAAMKAGAGDVLCKPITAAELVKKLSGDPVNVHATETPTLDRAIWEHVQRVFQDCHGNRSEAARRLRIDRGTLNRWLIRPAPRG